MSKHINYSKRHHSRERMLQGEAQLRRDSEQSTCGTCGAYCVKGPEGWTHRGPCNPDRAAIAKAKGDA